MIRVVAVISLVCLLVMVLYLPSAHPPERFLAQLKAEHDATAAYWGDAPALRILSQVTVYKHYERVEIHHRGAVVAGHERVIGERDVRRTLPGHHTVPQRAPREPALAEQLLRGEHEVLQRYASALKLHQHHGRGVRALHRLVQIKRSYPIEPFLAAVEQALKFGLFDLTRLEHLVLRHVAGDFFALGGDDGSDDDDA